MEIFCYPLIINNISICCLVSLVDDNIVVTDSLKINSFQKKLSSFSLKMCLDEISIFIFETIREDVFLCNVQLQKLYHSITIAKNVFFIFIIEFNDFVKEWINHLTQIENLDLFTTIKTVSSLFSLFHILQHIFFSYGIQNSLTQQSFPN